MTKFRIASALAVASLVLAACSSGSQSTLPSTRSSAANGIGNGVQAPVANPTSLKFTAVGAANAQTFTVSIQFAGDLTAVSSDTGVATVSPSSASPTVTPTGGGTKSATFTVTPAGNGTATITVTDKKGGTVAVSVNVTAGPDGQVAVFTYKGRIQIFKPGDIGPSAIPTATLQIPNASGDMVGRMDFDPNGNLWVEYYDNSRQAATAVAEYTKPFTTNEAPAHVLSGTNTGLFSPLGISYNSTLNEVFVADRNVGGTCYVAAFDAAANGDVAPLRTVSGPSGSCDGYGTVASDSKSIYVGNPGINVFGLTQSGDGGPLSTILDRQWGANYGQNGISANNDSVTAFSYDVAGNLFAYFNGQYVLEFPATGLTVTSLPTGVLNLGSWGQRDSISTDDNGYLYMASTNDNVVNVYGPYTANSIPASPAALNSAAFSADGDLVQSLAVYTPAKAAAAIPK